MNLTAVTRLHYGIDYLPWVVRSSRPLAARHVLLYNANPSFRPGRFRPEWLETRDQMHAALFEADKDRVHWVDDKPIDVFSVLDIYPDTEAILELDADEVLSPELAMRISDQLESGTMDGTFYRIPMVHHWRSFGYVCKNPGWPPRLRFPRQQGGERYFDGGYEGGCIHHFGYCRKRRDMEYKVDLSMHAPEWRPEWWAEKYNRFPEVLQDVHPCIKDMWNAEPFDREEIASFMSDHPYYNLEVVD